MFGIEKYPISLRQVRNWTGRYGTASGTNTYILTLQPSLEQYTTGQVIEVKFTNANSGASTININSLGAKSIVKKDGSAIATGDILAGGIYLLFYDGTNFQIDNTNTASGTVTSVALSMPGIFSVAGSPITSSGTFTVSLANQTANTIFAGPTSGGSAAPTFRALVAADLPNLSGTYYQNGGNAFMANATIGLTDNYRLDFKTNNTTWLTILPTGEVGIGTTSPTRPLEILGISPLFRRDGAATGFQAEITSSYKAAVFVDPAGMMGIFSYTTSNYHFEVDITNGTSAFGSNSGNITESDTRLKVNGLGSTNATFGFKVKNSTGGTTNFSVRDDGAIFTLFTLFVGAGTTSGSQINLAPGVAPATPTDGDIYYVNTNDRLLFYKNATACEIISASAVTTEALTTDTSLTITFNGTTYKLLAKS